MEEALFGCIGFTDKVKPEGNLGWFRDKPSHFFKFQNWELKTVMSEHAKPPVWKVKIQCEQAHVCLSAPNYFVPASFALNVGSPARPQAITRICVNFVDDKMLMPSKTCKQTNSKGTSWPPLMTTAIALQ
jgi:hypothetical protein